MNQDRYQRQITLAGFGIEGQQKLQKAKVLVVGAGGLGIPVLTYLKNSLKLAVVLKVHIFNTNIC